MVAIREITAEDAAALAEMLGGDAVLRADLGFRDEQRETADGVLRHVREWCRSRQAVSYAILADGVTVGLMSLSHIDPTAATGRIGYWVGSDHRRRGYCSQAFALVLQEARRRGVSTLSALIHNDNAPSRRLWESAGGIGTPESAERMRYTLEIVARTLPCP